MRKHLAFTGFVAALMGVASAIPATAADRYWNGAVDGDFNSSSNWTTTSGGRRHRRTGRQ